MTQKVVCDLCGAETTEKESDFYNVNRFTEREGARADVCPECLPPEIEKALNVDTFEGE